MLNDATVTCPTCGAPCTSNWQCHFGAVSDLPSYGIGDAARWSGAHWFGQPTMSLVYAVAYAAQDPAYVLCGTENITAEILIRNGLIEEIGNPRVAPCLHELLYEGENREPRDHDDLYCMPSGRPLR